MEEVLSLLEGVKLSRDCDARLIPVGTLIKLPAGSQVYITQSLGGSFTVKVGGNIARIEAEDADALGKESTGLAFDAATDPGTIKNYVNEALDSVYDPEIPVSIVALGLVYDCQLLPTDSGNYRVAIRMTLTSPGCGMGEVLKQEVEKKIMQVPTIEAVEVELVFDPPWDRSRISEEAKLELGML